MVKPTLSYLHCQKYNKTMYKIQLIEADIVYMEIIFLFITYIIFTYIIVNRVEEDWVFFNADQDKVSKKNLFEK